jgi:hypothetical protein
MNECMGFQNQPASWEERFEELVKFKEENGTCQVHKSVPVLGQWVKQQRKEYRYYVQGSKPSRMNQDRIAKLSSIGFDFGEQRWNTSKMKQAHAAIEKGKAQEASQGGVLLSSSSASLVVTAVVPTMMPTGDRFQLHPPPGPLHHHHHHHHLVTVPGFADDGDSASSDQDGVDHSAQQRQQQPLQQVLLLVNQEQQPPPHSEFRHFQPAPWEDLPHQQQEQQRYL